MTTEEFATKMKEALARSVPANYRKTINIKFLLDSELINWVVDVCAQVAKETGDQDS